MYGLNVILSLRRIRDSDASHEKLDRSFVACPARSEPASGAHGPALREASLRAEPRGSSLRMTRSSRGGHSGKVLDIDRGDVLGEREAEHARVEVELGFERALDGFGLAEAVLLAFEGEVRDRQVLGAQHFDH